MSRQLRRTALALFVAFVVGPSLGAQLAPIPQDRGGTGLGLSLRRLGVTARALYVTAHPDDEHNGVLVRLRRGLGVRTALFTLTRGEGGQNAIGPELGEALGVLRTEELAAVHRWDGVEQYFGRAYEFGYSFSVEESLTRWGREETLGDVVRVIRAFRPDVILTLPLEAKGGGLHHQATAQLARDAFRAAADPGRFPEQLAAGLPPWQARKIYQGGTGGFPEKLPGTPVVVKTGLLDPLLGLSWQATGSLARANHRCQGADQLLAAPNEGEGRFALVDSEPPVSGAEADVMDGVDASLLGLLRFADSEPARAALASDLDSLQRAMDAARAAFDPEVPSRTLSPLASVLAQVSRLHEQAAAGAFGQAGRFDLVSRLEDQEQAVLAALPLAQGLAFEAVADDGELVPGQTVTVTTTVANQGSSPLAVEEVTLALPNDWVSQRTDGAPREVEPGGTLRLVFSVTVSAAARPTEPYWRRRGVSDRYDLELPEQESLPWSPPPVVAVLRYAVAGVPAGLRVPALVRYQGRWVGGEKQKTLTVVPPLSLRLEPDLLVLPLGGRAGAKLLRVTVRNATPSATQALVRLEAPAGFRVDPPTAKVSFRSEGEEQTLRFSLQAPPRLAEGQLTLRAVAEAQGRVLAEEVVKVAYDHIEERILLRPAQSQLLALKVSTSAQARVGYVMGSGDAGPEALRQLGVPVSLLSAEDLAFGDLDRYTTIVTGIRAYETRSDLRAHHARLLAFVERGGHLVVQYNRAAFNRLAEPRSTESLAPASAKAESPFAPYPAAVTSERVTDETAPIKVLAPRHPLLTTPNLLTESDWQGWVQERGIQLLETRDARYLELLSSTDPFPLNPGEKKGLLVEAKVGKGSWTYLGLVLFRQLPAGVPGAYRLLANLVSRPRGR